MAFGIPDFGEIEQLGKNLVTFMSEVNIKLDSLNAKINNLEKQISDLSTNLKEKNEI